MDEKEGTVMHSKYRDRRKVLDECHRSKFTIHPRGTKMYQDMKRSFYWEGMKRDIGLWVRQRVNCQQVKVEHQKPSGLLQPLEILVWKWDSVPVDFIDGLPKSSRGNESIWVTMDSLTMNARFILVKSTRTAPVLAKLFMKNIVRLHGVPNSIVSDKDALVTSEFWNILQEVLGTKLKMGIEYYL